MTLRQRADGSGDRTATAWFLPGGSAAHWLELLARCGWAEPGTRLYVVPTSVPDRAPAGLLVVPEARARSSSAASPDSAASVVAAGLPCRAIAEKLYIPADAVLHPALTEAEVRSMCPGDVALFHPALGWSAFGAQETLRIWDLLELPEERLDPWNQARAGEPPVPGLQAIALALPPTLEQLFGDAAAAIGQKSLDDAPDLPPAPDEPRENPLAKTGRNLKKLLAGRLSRLLGMVPHRGSRRTWVNKLEDWASRQAQDVQAQLERLRHKELHRLLHLLQSDPEAGLRHAIPLNEFAHRGVAPPGAHLGERPLDFDPSRVGGQAADFWAVPSDLQLQLRHMYRELAGREMRLGRYRRAAYIYAQLLGDLPSAASVLKQGGLFREAALLYEEQLHNAREAARCLAEGGLLTEAIERFEKLELWLEVADLYERLGNPAASSAALRRVVHQRLDQCDVLGAAQLLEERLHQPDEAVALLRHAWPASPQAVACLGKLFALLGRLGRHEAALEQLSQIQRERQAPAQLLPLLDVLQKQALHYPDQRIRHHAADLSRSLISSRLQIPATPADEVARLLSALQHLAPEDRLLARDANRHLAARRDVEAVRRRPAPAPKSGRAPIVCRRFQLPRPLPSPDGSGWLSVRAEGPWFFALGLAPQRQLLLLRGIWDGDFQSLSWRGADALSPHGLVFEITGENSSKVLLALSGLQRLQEKIFPAQDRFYNQECRVSTPSWLPDDARPFVLGEEAAWSARFTREEAVLTCYNLDGQLLHTLDIAADLFADTARTPKARVCLSAVGASAAIGVGNRLIITRPGSPPERVELPGQLVRLCPTLRHTRLGVVAILESGAHLYWRGSANPIELDRDLPSPACAFLPGGPIVLVSRSTGLLLEVDGKGVVSQTRFECACPHPVAVSRTDRLGQFALFDAKGEVVVYRTARE